jgi:ElaB/YqjD/DUF883 family membrane-anchored ribosome-binding protein
MDNDAKVTREQMDETRASLSEKMETLEQHVVHTVQGATNSVQETVDNVKDAVHDTVENVKDTLDLPLQVMRHPWGMVGGSVAIGYLGGYLLLRRGSDGGRADSGSPPAPSDRPRIIKPENGVAKRFRSANAVSATKPAQESSQGPSAPGWLSEANNQFGPEITRLKGLAIGTILSVARDLITQAAPEQMKGELAKVMDGITVKLGGDPIQGAVLKDGFGGRDENKRRATSEVAKPMEAVRQRGRLSGGILPG